MYSGEKIKALIDLLASEPQFSRQLAAQLRQIIRKQPQSFKDVIYKDFGGAVPLHIAEVISGAQREALTQPFKWFFRRRSPGLQQGLTLIARFITPNLQEGDIIAAAGVLTRALDGEMDNSFDIFHKAEVFELVLFNQLNFKLESLNANAKLLCLPDIVKERKTTAFGMAVLYALLAENFGVLADIDLVAGKPIVRFRDMISFEPVYIDVSCAGQFVSEEECSLYAAGKGVKWDGKNITLLSAGEIIKRLLGNLVYVYSRAGAGAQAQFNLERLRKIMQNAQGGHNDGA
jgi:hypothetical protein